MVWDEEPQNAVILGFLENDIVNSVCKLDYTLNQGKREKLSIMTSILHRSCCSIALRHIY